MCFFLFKSYIECRLLGGIVIDILQNGPMFEREGRFRKSLGVGAGTLGADFERQLHGMRFMRTLDQSINLCVDLSTLVFFFLFLFFFFLAFLPIDSFRTGPEIWQRASHASKWTMNQKRSVCIWHE